MTDFLNRASLSESIYEQARDDDWTHKNLKDLMKPCGTKEGSYHHGNRNNPELKLQRKQFIRLW